MTQGVRAVAFDLDGTLYFGETIAPGALELVAALRERGILALYFTNSSVKTRDEIWEKLVRLGLPAERSEVYTSGFATAVWARENGFSRVMLVGSEGLARELRSQGVDVVEDESAEALVVGLDPRFISGECRPPLERLGDACPIVACNLDMSYPTEGGELKPGCGAIVADVEAVCGREHTVVVGKPDTYMLHMLATDWDLDPAAIVVVGDSYDSDIAGALAAGSPSVLVGAGGPSQLPPSVARAASLAEVAALVLER